MQDVWAVAVDPANPDVLIAGTRPAGFWRSADAGRGWSSLIAPGIIPASDVNAGPTRGGLSVSIRGDDGVRYYGSHFEAINTNIRPGVRVRAGQPLGKVGDTGDASACHLHFGLSPICAGTGDWWNQRGVIWPWRYFDSWRKGGDRSPVAEITAWQHQHGCPTKPTVDP